MENLKIKVNSIEESKEAQELFFELGYRWPVNGRIVCHTEYKIIHAWYDGDLTKCNNEVGDFSKFKEITLQELRDMVVLKQNELKPIEKEMKEYLELLPNGNYVLVKSDKPFHSSWVEVPDGALAMTKRGSFYKNKDGGLLFKGFDGGGWELSAYAAISQINNLVWQRSLNDKVASAEVARQDNVNNPKHYTGNGIECIDAMQAMLTPEQFIGYLRGNAFKYSWRYNNKGGVEYLKKAQWYLNKLIEVEAS